MSYEIHPETPPQGVRLERLFGPGYRERQEGIAARCRELGLPFQAPEVLSNSRQAVEAAEFARDVGKFSVFHRAALVAYFGQGQDIGDVAVLQEVAAEAGMDGEALAEVLAEGRYADRRIATEREAWRLRIPAVPTFIFHEHTRVVGAQPVDQFRLLLNQIITGRRE